MIVKGARGIPGGGATCERPGPGGAGMKTRSVRLKPRFCVKMCVVY